MRAYMLYIYIYVCTICKYEWFGLNSEKELKKKEIGIDIKELGLELIILIAMQLRI